MRFLGNYMKFVEDYSVANVQTESICEINEVLIMISQSLFNFFQNISLFNCIIPTFQCPIKNLKYLIFINCLVYGNTICRMPYMTQRHNLTKECDSNVCQKYAYAIVNCQTQFSYIGLVCSKYILLTNKRQTTKKFGIYTICVSSQHIRFT